MSDIKHIYENKTDCSVECPAGLDECVECGACDHCGHDASLDESELPPNWLNFIEKSKSTEQ